MKNQNLKAVSMRNEMKRYAVYLSGKFFGTFGDYLAAKKIALYYHRPYSWVEIVDMADGALCYYWIY